MKNKKRRKKEEIKNQKPRDMYRSKGQMRVKHKTQGWFKFFCMKKSRFFTRNKKVYDGNGQK